jgi:hypothetical protein
MSNPTTIARKQECSIATFGTDHQTMVTAAHAIHRHIFTAPSLRVMPPAIVISVQLDFDVVHVDLDKLVKARSAAEMRCAAGTRRDIEHFALGADCRSECLG